MNTDILFETRGSVAWLTFNRPSARNALTLEMYEEMLRRFTQVNGDRSIAAMVISGAEGRGFGAGADINLFRHISTPDEAMRYLRTYERVMVGLDSVRVPTIAAIAGNAAGGGGAIAVACDYRIASPTARIGFPVARTLGNCLPVSLYARLSLMIGSGRVRDLIFKAQMLSARDAMSIGLISEIVENEAGLLRRAEEIAIMFATERAPLSLLATRQALLGIEKRLIEDDSDLLMRCFMSADFKEGVQAFLGRRAPRWRGE